ncbi:8120_t:CDS:1 [Cetraspora pellucida]|uniref:8120_t:CDS:1 n=1 Tax=Cetraspora pellucida TaxID=1433469 RepID=A0A9N9DIX4_9GLOM|nr:8120_t:CDS:1 [Cetraspora pellucida]
MYWLSEIRKELEYYRKDLTEEELRECSNMMTILINLSLEANNTNDIFDSDESCIMNQNTSISAFTSNVNIFIESETKLNIENLTDLTLSFFNFNITESYNKEFRPQHKQTSSKDYENMNFEASNIVDKVLGIENDNN